VRYLDRFNSLDEFDERSLDLGLRFGRWIGEHGRAGTRVGLYRVEADQEGVTLNPRGRDDIPTLAGYLGWDSRDSVTLPRRGWWSEIDMALNGLGGDGDFWTVNFDARRYHPIGGGHTLVFSTLLTLQSGEVGIDVPIHQDFHIGGSNTVRGWPVDARHGKNQLLGTAEWRTTLMEPKAGSFKGMTAFLGIQVALFADVGIAWDHAPEFGTRNVIGGVGVGLRLLVPFVNMIRLDFAYGDRSSSMRSHFAVLEKTEMQRRRVR